MLLSLPALPLFAVFVLYPLFRPQLEIEQGSNPAGEDCPQMREMECGRFFLLPDEYKDKAERAVIHHIQD